MLLGHQGRVHARVDHFGSILAAQALTNGQQLDGIAGIICRGNIVCRDIGNSLAVHVLELHAGVETDGGHDGGLGRRVMPLHVRGGIRLGIAQAGSFCQGLVIGGAGGFHGIQDVVGRAVDDAGDALDLVACQGATQHTHDGDGGGNGGLKVQVNAGAFGGLGQFISVRGNERLIRRHHGLAGIKRGQHQLAREIDPADDLHHQVDIIAGDQGLGIIGQQFAGHARAQLILVLDGDATDLCWPTDAMSKGIRIFI